VRIYPCFIAAQYSHVGCIRLLGELDADVNKCTTRGASPVFVAAEKGHVDCVRLLGDLGADINKCDDEDASPVSTAAQHGHVVCVRLLSELVANVQPLLQLADATTVLGTNIVQIVLDIRSFLDATGLSQSPHQYTLYSLAQLAAYYLQRRHYADQQLQDIVDDFASRFAAVIVAPFEVAAAKASTTPAQRKLVTRPWHTLLKRRNRLTWRWWQT
jgi:hypothetical protein